jgi:DNA polymerase-3 subunit alpha
MAMAEEPVVKTPLSTEEAEKQYPGPSEFVHLHNHTLFSLLDGVANPSDYFKSCAERKWPAIAITEHGVLNSIPDAYLASKETKVKYIVGYESYFNDFEAIRRKLFAGGTSIYKLREENPDLASRIGRNRHLTILAKNENGYKNILRINREAWLNGFYYKPRVGFDLLAKYKDDLIILSGCLNGPVCHELRNNNLKSNGYITGAIDYVKKFRQVFADDFYLEVQMPGVDGDIEVFRKIASIGDHLKIRTVLTNDSHYLIRKDFELQKVMMAIDQKTTIDDPNLFHVNSDEQFLKTRAELRATFYRNGYSDRINNSVFELSCDATLEIADKCSTFKPNLEPKLPRIENSDAELIRLAEEGLKRKGLDKDDTEYIYDEKVVTYRKQMELELKRIISKRFSSYFLITLDLIKASINKGWPVGPGRGSVGGSLVSYLIGIHSLDPIKWGLSFNRFMSPARGGNMLKVTME